jgi:hypothetical protein
LSARRRGRANVFNCWMPDGGSSRKQARLGPVAVSCLGSFP